MGKNNSTPTPEQIERFWEKTDRSGGEDACWPWIACKHPRGYGQVNWMGKSSRAHRVAYELAKGPFDPSLYVLHACDVPACCNPKHLSVGTQADNMQDCSRKGRAAAGMKSARAKLTDEQVREIRQRRESGESTVKLSREYGVVTSQIWYITHYVQRKDA